MARPESVHWVGDAPTSLHGNGAASFAQTTRDPAKVTCGLCLSILTRLDSPILDSTRPVPDRPAAERVGSEREEPMATRTRAPYYEDEWVTLYHGDCREFLADWASGKPDHLAQITVTSPPYNMGLTPGGNGRGMYRPSASRKGGRFREGYGEHDDAMPQEDYDEWQRDVLDLIWECTPDDGAIFYNHRVRVEHGKARLPLGLDFGDAILRQIITWDRGTGIGVNLRQFCAVAEWICLLAKPGFRLKSHSASGMGDIWRLGMEPDRSHPASFPIGLPMRAIDASAAKSVFDPFAGSGTTLVAAKQLGVKAIGVELSERYCEIAAQRLTQDSLFRDGK